MRKTLKSSVKAILAHCGYQLVALDTFPVRLTEKEKIQSLISSLSPLSTDKKLIRLGPKSDGGYLIPDDLVGVEACFSPGVSNISGFEKDCANLGMKVFLADKSVEKPKETHDQFHFSRKFIGATTNDDFVTMDDWVTSSLPNSEKDLMLQIDIEGYEYETFLSMSSNLLGRFRIIVAEFHHLEQLWNGPFYQLVSRAFEKILQTHRCIHIHPNNRCLPLEKEGLSIPPLLEMTFLRKDRIHRSSRNGGFPHPLDCDNTARPPLPLPTCWYE